MEVTRSCMTSWDIIVSIPGVGGRPPTTKDSGGDETARLREIGRLQLRWEDCVKRDVRKTGEADKWKEKAADRELEQCSCTRTSPTPL